MIYIGGAVGTSRNGPTHPGIGPQHHRRGRHHKIKRHNGQGRVVARAERQDSVRLGSPDLHVSLLPAAPPLIDECRKAVLNNRPASVGQQSLVIGQIVNRYQHRSEHFVGLKKMT